MNRSKIYFPAALGIVLAAGIFIGTRISGTNNYGQSTAFDKIRFVLNDIQQHYVDSVDAKKLTEKSITAMLQSLDPHSDYFSAVEAKAVDEPLRGKFDGVGIQYNIINDTIAIIDVVRGGPSEHSGILPGDRLVSVNGFVIAGKNFPEDSIRARLRGVSGTTVKVGVVRREVKGVKEYTLTRGTVPIRSIDVAYMINSETGYIKLSRFAVSSYDEFVEASDSLEKKGMKKMILDLRDNTGGYLDIAVDLADEFLPQGKKIVFTKGNHSPRKDYVATSKGKYEKMPVAVIINENSASASEIIAGALQDNDRGVIVGLRSFGKGLVQEERKLPDGSAYRITVARYYTPVERCIQKPYSKGIDAYLSEEHDRYTNGELLNADSIHFPDSLRYTTPGGKTVYGGGGIMPDEFVPIDTALGSKMLNRIYNRGYLNDFTFLYADAHRKELKNMGLEKFISSFSVSDAIVNEFVAFVRKKGMTIDDADLKRSDSYLRLTLKAYIARAIWNSEGFYPIFHQKDKTLDKAVEKVRV